jgi:hypothetical protein
MALELTRNIVGPAREGDLIADRELYTDANGQIVEARDTSRAFLLIAPGQILRHEDAARYGVRLEGGKLAWGEVVAAVPEAPAESVEPVNAKEVEKAEAGAAKAEVKIEKTEAKEAEKAEKAEAKETTQDAKPAASPPDRPEPRHTPSFRRRP